MRHILLIPFATALLVPGIASAEPTAKFLQDAIKGDNSEMHLGALAAAQGGSAAMRSFGRTLERDHTNAKADAVALARRDRVAVPTVMMPEAAAEYRKVSRMHGAAFDREFARYMVDDHQKDIAEFSEQARTGREGTAALATKTLPHLREHLRIARSLS